MNTTIGIVKYHWRRRWFLSMVFVVALVALVLGGAVAMLMHSREISQMVSPRGNLVDHVSYSGVAFLDDPSRLIEPSAFGLLVFLFSIVITKHDRQFLVSISVPRYQILLGSFLFLSTLSVVLALIGGIVAPAICRVILLAAGFPLSGGWSAQTILYGGNAGIWRSILVSICDMIGTAGVYTLIAYVVLRWWKVLLILFGAMIAMIILAATMVQWETFLSDILMRAADWVEWAMEQLIPWLENFFSEQNQMAWAVRRLSVGLVCMVISYPVMRGMKVV